MPVFWPPRIEMSMPFSTDLLLNIWADVGFCQGLFTKRELNPKDLRIFLEKLKKNLRKI